MSTALCLWSSSSNGDEDQEKKLPLEAHEQLNVEPAKPARSKRAAKSQAALPKKQPKRGLGVAQLERLRMQESKSLPPSLVPVALNLSQNHHFPFAFPVVDPETGMSMARIPAPEMRFQGSMEYPYMQQQPFYIFLPMRPSSHQTASSDGRVEGADGSVDLNLKL